MYRTLHRFFITYNNLWGQVFLIEDRTSFEGAGECLTPCRYARGGVAPASEEECCIRAPVFILEYFAQSITATTTSLAGWRRLMPGRLLPLWVWRLVWHSPVSAVADFGADIATGCATGSRYPALVKWLVPAAAIWRRRVAERF